MAILKITQINNDGNIIAKTLGISQNIIDKIQSLGEAFESENGFASLINTLAALEYFEELSTKERAERALKVFDENIDFSDIHKFEDELESELATKSDFGSNPDFDPDSDSNGDHFPRIDSVN